MDNLDLEEKLEQFFHHKQFKSQLQREAINEIVNGKGNGYELILNSTDLPYF